MVSLVHAMALMLKPAETYVGPRACLERVALPKLKRPRNGGIFDWKSDIQTVEQFSH